MPDLIQDTSPATFPPLLFHNGELRLIQDKESGRWAIMLFIDGWYVDKDEAEYVMRDHWQKALEEVRDAQPR